jgi:hypothetical protein
MPDLEKFGVRALFSDNSGSEHFFEQCPAASFIDMSWAPVQEMASKRLQQSCLRYVEKQFPKKVL